MFKDGLHNTVDIFFINHIKAQGNRNNLNNIKVSETADLEEISCRIIKDEKVLFMGDIKLKDGDTFKDRDTGVIYEVYKKESGIYNSKGLNNKSHHSSYSIRIKKESDRK